MLNVLLEEWKKDQTNKILIFTKSVKLLEMLDYHLNVKSKRAIPMLDVRITDDIL